MAQKPYSRSPKSCQAPATPPTFHAPQSSGEEILPKFSCSGKSGVLPFVMPIVRFPSAHHPSFKSLILFSNILRYSSSSSGIQRKTSREWEAVEGRQKRVARISTGNAQGQQLRANTPVEVLVDAGKDGDARGCIPFFRFQNPGLVAGLCQE